MVALAPDFMPAFKGKEDRDEESRFLPLRIFSGKFIYVFFKASEHSQ